MSRPRRFDSLTKQLNKLNDKNHYIDPRGPGNLLALASTKSTNG